MVVAIAYQDSSTRLLVKKMIGMHKAPETTNSELSIEEFIVGLSSPTTMTFLGDDILFVEKYTGKIRLIRDGSLVSEPTYDFNVHSAAEAGLLGIHSVDNSVYVYVTESNEDGGESTSHNVYRFEWNNDKLQDAKLVNSFEPYDSSHNGGIITSNQNKEVFVIRGDQLKGYGNLPGPLQNSDQGKIDDTGVIVRVGIDKFAPTPALSQNPLEHYYGIGIRNSFGLTVDPFTDYLWDTENGDEDFDEINLVLPNFNSGWIRIMGMANETQKNELPIFGDFIYSDPEFVWEEPVAPTAIAFVGDRWGNSYINSVFVGACNGNLYHFKLNDERTGFIFENPELKDLVLNLNESDDEIVHFSNLGCITDIKFGPDNAMYVVSFSTTGIIYKVIPN